MQNYTLIHTTIDRVLANKTAEVLENEGIAVLIEHIEIKSTTDNAHGFRILVPVQSAHESMRLLQMIMDVNNVAYAA
ncbi:MAG: hypothetical protein KDD62_03605 [Bdellovibrionales bacterium]|nr:hypothetical protein [Bdellovibrionales bacterium]